MNKGSAFAAAASSDSSIDYSPPKSHPTSAASRWNPRNWGWKAWAVAAAGLIILIIIIVVPAVVVTEKNDNAYPNYTSLSYSLVDTYSGANFFDNFDYFVGYDPSSGFVQYVSRLSRRNASANTRTQLLQPYRLCRT